MSELLHFRLGIRQLSSSTHLIRTIISSCTLLCSVAVASASDGRGGIGQNVSNPSGAVRGYVYCADTGQPARFALVRIQSVASLGSEPHSGADTPNAARTTTGLDGSFLIQDLSPGSYVVLATLEGYVFPLAQFSWDELIVDSQSPVAPVRKRILEVLPKVNIEPDQTAALTLRLERGADITGIALYDDGSPVINAQVRIYRFSATKKQWQDVELPTDGWPLRKTDDRGGYRITGLPAGRYLVSVRIPPDGGSSNAILGGQISPDFGASYPGYLEMYFGDTVRQKSATAVDLTAGEHRSAVDIHFSLSKLRTVSGTVSAESDGHELSQVALQLTFVDDKSKFLIAHSGRDGTFHIPFVPEGDYIATVSAAPEDGPHGLHSYRIVDLPLSVHGNLTGIEISLPDAQR